MIQTKCLNGHYFDCEEYEYCPICGAVSIEKDRIPDGEKKKSGFSLNPVTVLNIAAYNGFMAIGLYLNLMFSYVLDESGCFGDWKDSLSPIVYCFVFLLFHKIVQHLTGPSGMTDEIYAVCYQSMLI